MAAKAILRCMPRVSAARITWRWMSLLALDGHAHAYNSDPDVSDFLSTEVDAPEMSLLITSPASHVWSPPPPLPRLVQHHACLPALHRFTTATRRSSCRPRAPRARRTAAPPTAFSPYYESPLRPAIGDMCRDRSSHTTAGPGADGAAAANDEEEDVVDSSASASLSAVAAAGAVPTPC